MAIIPKSRPVDDPVFSDLLDKLEDRWMLHESRRLRLPGPLPAGRLDGWEEARDKLELIISDLTQDLSAAEEAREYASKQAEIKKSVGGGWECSGCGTGTFSRCLACDGATCGLCLISHECPPNGNNILDESSLGR